jgi:hypothetical protein
MIVAFVLSKSSHNTVFATSDVNRMCVDEDDDFYLVGAQSYVHQSLSTQIDVTFALSVPGVQSRCEGTCQWSNDLAS